MRTSRRPMYVLDWDLENRPLSYWIPERPTAEITAIAYAWVTGTKCGPVRSLLLGEDDPYTMLSHIRQQIVDADMVTGHYIRRHDLPILNGALVEYDLEPLPPVLTSDTKLDLVRYYDLPASQEELSALVGVSVPKVHMRQVDWREANRLTEKGIELTRKRVEGDIKQHHRMRMALIKRGMLGDPKVWRGER